MKQYILLLILGVCTVAQGQLKTPSLSPSSTLTQTVGLTKITVDYSRPSAKGRIIFGDQGILSNNTVWRTGANNATKISFSEDVLIADQLLKKGSYTILTTLQKNQWVIRWFVYETTNWIDYKTKNPVLEVTVKKEKTKTFVETFEIHIQDITLDSASFVLEWEQTQVKIPIKLDEQQKILASIERTLRGPSSFDYYNMAIYLHESKIDLNKALHYIQKVTASEKAFFFQVTREAMILKDLGQKQASKKVAQRALLLSEKAKNEDFIKINKALIDK